MLLKSHELNELLKQMLVIFYNSVVAPKRFQLLSIFFRMQFKVENDDFSFQNWTDQRKARTL